MITNKLIFITEGAGSFGDKLNLAIFENTVAVK